MGWLYQKQKLRHETPVQYFKRELTFSKGDVSATVLDAAAARGTVYAAVRNQDRRAGTDYVFCAVILFKNTERDGFVYKTMRESMGPCEVDCPDRIMRLLSPVEQIPNPSYTSDWRARVAAAKTKRKTTEDLVAQLKHGVTIKVGYELTFAQSGIRADTFRFLFRHKRTLVFEPTGHSSFLCRLLREALAMATIVTPEPVAAGAADA